MSLSGGASRKSNESVSRWVGWPTMVVFQGRVIWAATVPCHVLAEGELWRRNGRSASSRRLTKGSTWFTPPSFSSFVGSPGKMFDSFSRRTNLDGLNGSKVENDLSFKCLRVSSITKFMILFVLSRSGEDSDIILSIYLVRVSSLKWTILY